VARFASGFGWLLVGVSVPVTALCVGLLATEAFNRSYDCKSQSIYGVVLLFFGLLPAGASSLFLLLPRVFQKRPFKNIALLIGLLILLQIGSLVSNDHLAGRLKEDCSAWQNG